MLSHCNDLVVSVLQAQNEYKGKNVSTKFIFLQEEDDVNNPISSESAFTNEEREILKNAGSNKLKAIQSTIVKTTNGYIKKNLIQLSMILF